MTVPGRPAYGALVDEVVVAGWGVGGGRVRGPVRVVHDVDGFDTVRRGDVLVCRTADPAWTPLFRVVSAVVTERGGLWCHAAIVAREVGIPAVVGAAGAVSLLRDGTAVTVDGDAGVVVAPPTQAGDGTS